MNVICVQLRQQLIIWKLMQLSIMSQYSRVIPLFMFATFWQELRPYIHSRCLLTPVRLRVCVPKLFFCSILSSA